MNRKERRAAKKARGDPAAHLAIGRAAGDPLVAQTFAAAIEHHRAGRLAEAAGLCRHVLAADPRHLGALHLLGVAARQAGRSDIAIDYLGRALAVDSRIPECHLEIGLALRTLGQLDAAAGHYKRAAALNPDFMEAHYNLANVLREQGKLDQAVDCYRRARTLYPAGAEIHNNLGIALMVLGRLAEADACFRQALTLKPDLIEAYNNLCTILLTQGDVDQALGMIRHALDIAEPIETKALFVRCAKRVRGVTHSHDFPDLVSRALSESWGRPRDLAGFGIALLQVDTAVSACAARASNAWPTRLAAQALGKNDELDQVYRSNLLRALLETTPICDVELERLLTSLRRVLLDAALDPEVTIDEVALSFYCALARQCFINEYVFDAPVDELALAGSLREKLAAALAAQAPIPVLWPIAVGSYFPLHSLPTAYALQERPWPDALAALLVQQVHEPLEEERCRASISRLTAIDHPVSLLVKQQYEESPYPRWLAPAKAGPPMRIEVYLQQQFPFAKIAHPAGRAGIDVLVVGCGTGLQAVETAQQYIAARVLAIDLSLTSLGYASRRTRELGLKNIEYAQADLLALPSIERSFDVIEASGVLHHLAEPRTGWQGLLSRLRPGGFMRLGLYSARARTDVAAARGFLAGRRHDGSPEALRRCRQDLMSLGRDAPARAVVERTDFYSSSECRDLLFHVQEVCFNLPDIKAFLAENRLKFIGFEVDAHILEQFKVRFGASASPADLDMWQLFENDNPGTFRGMYQFWLQKR